MVVRTPLGRAVSNLLRRLQGLLGKLDGLGKSPELEVAVAHDHPRPQYAEGSVGAVVRNAFPLIAPPQ